jgi:hypothetical protein
MGPFKSREDAVYLMKSLRVRRNPAKTRAKYCRERQLSPGLFDPRSFRVIPLGKSGKKGIIGCPKGHWSRKAKKCKVGTRLQSILYPVGGERCPRPGLELKKYRRNPGEEWHNRRFMEWLRESDKYKLGSIPYISAIARAYENLEAAQESVKQGVR